MNRRPPRMAKNMTMPDNPKQKLLRQMVVDSDRLQDLARQRAAGDESQGLKQEIDALEEAIQVKTALVSGMKEMPGLAG